MEDNVRGLRSFEKGGLTEAVVLASLTKAGYAVLIPFGVVRYDLAIDARNGEGIKTVQCKTGRTRGGCIIWATCSTHTLTYVKTEYRGQVDYFTVWCPEYEDDVYLVPVNEVGIREGSLRIKPAERNWKDKPFRWAEDYKVSSLNETIKRDVA